MLYRVYLSATTRIVCILATDDWTEASEVRWALLDTGRYWPVDVQVVGPAGSC